MHILLADFFVLVVNGLQNLCLFKKTIMFYNEIMIRIHISTLEIGG